MSTVPSTTEAAEALGFPGVQFGVSSDGLPVALVADTAFAMMTSRDGTFSLATAWKINRPLDQWKRSDFYSFSGELADEADFRAKVAENAEHQREKQSLGRREIGGNSSSPWGTAQSALLYAEGVISFSTASHGGFRLSPDRNAEVRADLRSSGGWYEEDEAWAIVALTFPALFTAFERRCAAQTIKDSWPEAWEAIHGTVLAPGESRTKDRHLFEREHVADWVVISAINSSHREGFVECVATMGGKRDRQSQERRFLVPKSEYDMGRFGFVIDPARHSDYRGPSDFIGWQRGNAA